MHGCMDGCVYVRMHARMCLCIHVCTHVCAHASMHVCMHICECIHVRALACLCNLYACICMRACVSMHVRLHVCMYACMSMYVSKHASRRLQHVIMKLPTTPTIKSCIRSRFVFAFVSSLHTRVQVDVANAVLASMCVAHMAFVCVSSGGTRGEYLGSRGRCV